MNKTIKQKWLKALRSGKYKQTQGYLKNEGGYCCLGVLCDLAAKEGIGTWDGDYFSSGYITVDGLLPARVMKWAGLSRNYGITYKKSTLDSLNDNGSSFKEIADIIEKRA